ncbi:hypothetical protein SUGI_1081380 [Cryptomeria japonica]|nr:hypothetical protein SUGI_1081380 [Cryptomeria japonica]
MGDKTPDAVVGIYADVLQEEAQKTGEEFAASDNFSVNGVSGSGPSTPVSKNKDWRFAFDTAANGPSNYSNSIANSPSINFSKMNNRLHLAKHEQSWAYVVYMVTIF